MVLEADDHPPVRGEGIAAGFDGGDGGGDGRLDVQFVRQRSQQATAAIPDEGQPPLGRSTHRTGLEKLARRRRERNVRQRRTAAQKARRRFFTGYGHELAVDEALVPVRLDVQPFAVLL